MLSIFLFLKKIKLLYNNVEGLLSVIVQYKYKQEIGGKVR